MLAFICLLLGLQMPEPLLWHAKTEVVSTVQEIYIEDGKIVKISEPKKYIRIVFDKS